MTSSDFIAKRGTCVCKLQVGIFRKLQYLSSSGPEFHNLMSFQQKRRLVLMRRHMENGQS
jgi:hypothetical protein